MIGSSVLRRLPPRVERALRVSRDPSGAYKRNAILRRLAAEPDNLPSRETLRSLKAAWGGGGVADVAYMDEMCRRARDCRQPILECGSGLTTVLLGIYARVPVVSLEEAERWAERMRAALHWYGITRVALEYCPIVDHGAYTWYRIPPGIPDRFSLVVCDGPIAHRKVGAPRYGLLPAMRDRFDESTVILLDDVARPSEANALHRWQDEGYAASIVDEAGRSFAIITAESGTVS